MQKVVKLQTIMGNIIKHMAHKKLDFQENWNIMTSKNSVRMIILETQKYLLVPMSLQKKENLELFHFITLQKQVMPIEWKNHLMLKALLIIHIKLLR
jgi:hypothetical protein